MLAYFSHTWIRHGKGNRFNGPWTPKESHVFSRKSRSCLKRHIKGMMHYEATKQKKRSECQKNRGAEFVPLKRCPRGLVGWLWSLFWCTHGPWRVSFQLRVSLRRTRGLASRWQHFFKRPTLWSLKFGLLNAAGDFIKYIYMYIYTHTNTYTYIYIYTHMYIHTCSRIGYSCWPTRDPDSKLQQCG